VGPRVWRALDRLQDGIGRSAFDPAVPTSLSRGKLPRHEIRVTVPAISKIQWEEK
jgi:hypothetical protein